MKDKLDMIRSSLLHSFYLIAIPNIDIENCKAWKKIAVTDL